MPQDERGLYYPWYPTRYLLGRTRFLLTLPERSVYRDLLDMIYEAGGEIVHDPQYLCAFTGATEHELHNVLNSGKFVIEDMKIRHIVADEVIAEMVFYIEAGRRGGVKSAQVRKEKYGTAQPVEPPSEPLPNPPSEPLRTPPSTPPSKQKERRKEEINKGTTPPADVDNFSGPATKTPGKVKPGFASETRRSNPPVKSPSTLTPERVQLLLDGCQPKDKHDRHTYRPWMSKMMGDWIDGQTSDDAHLFRNEYLKRFGYSLDLGPGAEVGGAA